MVLAVAAVGFLSRDSLGGTRRYQHRTGKCLTPESYGATIKTLTDHVAPQATPADKDYIWKGCVSSAKDSSTPSQVVIQIIG